MNNMEMSDKDIVFSRSIKAGKRIYYIDVKKNRREELFVAITESKKITMGDGENAAVSYEKHKIFLYKEDFERFLSGLTETIEFVNQNQPAETAGQKNDSEEDIKINIDFDN